MLPRAKKGLWGSSGRSNKKCKPEKVLRKKYDGLVDPTYVHIKEGSVSDFKINIWNSPCRNCFSFFWYTTLFYKPPNGVSGYLIALEIIVVSL